MGNYNEEELKALIKYYQGMLTLSIESFCKGNLSCVIMLLVFLGQYIMHVGYKRTKDRFYTGAMQLKSKSNLLYNIAKLRNNIIHSTDYVDTLLTLDAIKVNLGDKKGLSIDSETGIIEKALNLIDVSVIDDLIHFYETINLEDKSSFSTIQEKLKKQEEYNNNR